MKFVNISILIIMIIIINSFIGLGANPSLPDEPSNVLINKIDSEHKNTRLYMKNQLIESQNAFIDEFTKRADYYEGALDDMINKFILKVSLVFGGIIVFVSAINQLIRNKLEKRKYAVFLESIKDDIKLDINKNMKDYLQLPENDINEFNKLNDLNQPQPIQKPNIEQKKKSNIFSKFKINKDDFDGVKQ